MEAIPVRVKVAKTSPNVLVLVYALVRVCPNTVRLTNPFRIHAKLEIHQVLVPNFFTN